MQLTATVPFDADSVQTYRATIQVNRRKYATLTDTDPGDLESAITRELEHISREQARINCFTEVRVLYHD